MYARWFPILSVVYFVMWNVDFFCMSVRRKHFSPFLFFFTSLMCAYKEIKKEKEAQENQIKTVAFHLTLGFNMKNQTVADGDYFRYTWFYDDSRLNITMGKENMGFYKELKINFKSFNSLNILHYTIPCTLLQHIDIYILTRLTRAPTNGI